MSRMLIQEIAARICKAVSVILPHPDRHQFINAQALSRKRPILDHLATMPKESLMLDLQNMKV